MQPGTSSDRAGKNGKPNNLLGPLSCEIRLSAEALTLVNHFQTATYIYTVHIAVGKWLKWSSPSPSLGSLVLRTTGSLHKRHIQILIHNCVFNIISIHEIMFLLYSLGIQL